MKKLFEISLEAQGFPLSKAKEDLQAIQHLDLEAFNAWQEEKKWRIYDYHFKNNVTYRDFNKNGKVKEWSDIPVLTKRDLQRPAEQILTSGSNKNNLYKGKTSGSSGKPLHYFKDKYAHAMTWALILNRYNWQDISYGDLQARFYAMPLKGLEYKKERIKDLISNRHRFIVHDLSERMLLNFIKVFKKKKFKYVYGYTNSLIIFARFLIAQNINLKELCPTLKVAIVTSETCTPDDVALLRQAFSIPIVNEYGSSEIDMLAFQNRSGEWVMSDENVFFEVLDEDNQQVSSGKSGKLVVTSLYNLAMPFIRYEVGDIAVINKSITNRNNRLIELQGRLNDNIHLPSGKLVPGFTLYYVTKALMNKVPTLVEYNIVQTSLDEIVYDIIMDGEISDEIKREIENLTFSYLEPGIKVKVNKVLNIKRTGAGKMKHFTSLLTT